MLENTEQLSFFRVFDFNSPRGYQWLYVFRNNSQEYSVTGLYQTMAEMNSFFESRRVNYGILLTVDGVLIALEDKLADDPLIVKLTTGMNIVEEHEFNFNAWLYGNGVDKNHSHFGHLVR